MSRKYLAKIDLILMLSKFSGHIGPKPNQTFCVPFNNLTDPTDLAVLMEAPLDSGELNEGLCRYIHFMQQLTCCVDYQLV
jgi:hypothetical protein